MTAPARAVYNHGEKERAVPKPRAKALKCKQCSADQDAFGCTCLVCGNIDACGNCGGCPDCDGLEWIKPAKGDRLVSRAIWRPREAP